MKDTELCSAAWVSQLNTQASSSRDPSRPRATIGEKTVLEELVPGKIGESSFEGFVRVTAGANAVSRTVGRGLIHEFIIQFWLIFIFSTSCLRLIAGPNAVPPRAPNAPPAPGRGSIWRPAQDSERMCCAGRHQGAGHQTRERERERERDGERERSDNERMRAIQEQRYRQ